MEESLFKLKLKLGTDRDYSTKGQFQCLCFVMFCREWERVTPGPGATGRQMNQIRVEQREFTSDSVLTV